MSLTLDEIRELRPHFEPGRPLFVIPAARGAATPGITNVMGSPLARTAEHVTL